MERSTAVRKRDAAATRETILTAARQRFLSESYDNVGLREIACAAGVDVALVSRYFGGKEGLFHEAIAHGKAPNVFLEPLYADDLPGFLARLATQDEDGDRQHRMEMFVIMLRSATSPKAGEIIRDLVRHDVLEPLMDLLGRDKGELRAHMLLAVLMGIGMLRTIMKIDGVTMDDAGRQECTERFRCLFAAALTC